MKKIVLLSKGDLMTANQVMMWLSTFDTVQVTRINDEDQLKDLDCTLSIDETTISINGIALEDYHSIWIFHGQLPKLFIPSIVEEIEFGVVKSYILNSLETATHCIGSCLPDLNHNKLIDLQIAKSYGLKIPKTRVMTSRKALLQFKAEVGDTNLIIKPLKNYYTKEIEDQLYTLDIFKLNQQEDIPIHFFPSLVQQKIEKKFEVRSFFIKGDFYSVAIFSQSQQATSLSFKNIDLNNLTRIVPFKLPSFLEAKLLKMFKTKRLNSGSVDLIYGQDKQFYFLEINPIGQFGWVSKLGNYYIEKEIAKKLSA